MSEGDRVVDQGGKALLHAAEPYPEAPRLRDVFNFSGSEIVFILLLALIILGPEKLPEAMRRFGQTYNEIKKLSSGFQSEFKQAFEEPMREMQATADELRRAATFSIDTEPVFVADPAPTAPVIEPAMSAPAPPEPEAPEEPATDPAETGESAGDDDSGAAAR
jgi:sec-independent protein translocase protein TatB